MQCQLVVFEVILFYAEYYEFLKYVSKIKTSRMHFTYLLCHVVYLFILSLAQK